MQADLPSLQAFEKWKSFSFLSFSVFANKMAITWQPFYLTIFFQVALCSSLDSASDSVFFVT